MTKVSRVKLFDDDSFASAALARGVPAFVLVNPIEYHGPHLSLRNDHLVSMGLAKDLHAFLRARSGERDDGLFPFLPTRDLDVGVEPASGPGSVPVSFAKPRGGALTVREHVAGSPDPVRLGGVGHVLRQQLQPHLKSEVRATVLGYVQRGGDPTPFDRVLATRFGHHAAQLVIDGQLGRMVTLQNGGIGSVEIAQVANTQRTVPPGHELITVARDIGVCFGDLCQAVRPARQHGRA